MYRYYLATDTMVGRRKVLDASEGLEGVVELYGIHSGEWRPFPEFDTFHDAIVVDESEAMTMVQSFAERARVMASKANEGT